MIVCSRSCIVILFSLCWVLFGVSGFSVASRRKSYNQLACRKQSFCRSLPADVTVEMSNDCLETSVRARLRTMTGFSLTALRTTMRAATGTSLSALYASTLAVSGFWIRQTMRVFLGIFPAWARYFVQPFLAMYYVPLFMLRCAIRNVTSMQTPKQRELLQKHEMLVESWKQAVAIADDSTSYWPLHINQNGDIESDIAELDLTEAIAESLEIAMEKKNQNFGTA
jgi:hypothetical protein